MERRIKLTDDDIETIVECLGNSRRNHESILDTRAKIFGDEEDTEKGKWEDSTQTLTNLEHLFQDMLPEGIESMTHQELLGHGCEYAKAEDHYGDTHTGYWMPGDGNGKGYGTYLGETPAAATQAIQG